MKEMPPGYRFFPTEEELISFYLRNKLEGTRNDHLNRVIPVLDVFDHEPWHLPKLSGELCHEDIEQWFFFVPRQEREARGGRPSRMTASGFWKATGSPSYVYSSDNRVIGVNKTMVFYKGKAPTGRKTKWKMNEYRAIDQETSAPFGFSVPKVRLTLKEIWCKFGGGMGVDLDSYPAAPPCASATACQSISSLQLRHELSLCRVYVIAGSFRAFDRRPLGTETRRISENQHLAHGHDAMPPSQATETGEKTSSSESSYSGGTNLGNFNGQDPLWEWEQLNWP